MGAKGAVEIIFRGKDVDARTLEYTGALRKIIIILSAAVAPRSTQVNP